MKNCLQSKTRKWSIFLAINIVDLTGLLFAFSLAYVSPIAVEIMKKGFLDNTTYPIFASMFNFGSLIGLIFSLSFVNTLGRKPLIVLSTIPGVLGWIVIIMGTSGHWLIIGRLLTGVSNGIATLVVPIYVGEITEAKTRGFFSSIMSQFITIGIFISFGAGIFLSYTWLAVIPICVMLVMAFACSFQPYSPVWLTQRGLKKTSLETLKYLRGTKYNIAEEQENILSIVKLKNEMNLKKKIAYFLQFHVFRTIVIALTIMAFNRFSGIGIVASYTSKILRNTTILTPNILALITIPTRVFATCLTSILIDRVGRKAILYISSLIIVLSYVTISIYFYFITVVYPQCMLKTEDINTCIQEQFEASEQIAVSNSLCIGLSVLLLTSMIALQFGLLFGWSPIVWTLLSEMFPLHVKPTVVALSITTQRVIDGLLVLLFPYYDDLVGSYYAFLTLAIINFLAIPFLLFFVPETKRKNITDIEILFKGTCCFINE